MKQRVVVAMLAVFALLSTVRVDAQVKMQVGALTWSTSATSCSQQWISAGMLRIIETQPDDFYGSNGSNNWATITLNIALPPGMEFEPNGVSTWTRIAEANSSNIQNGTGTISYSWTNPAPIINAKYGSMLVTDVWPATAPLNIDNNSAVNTISIVGLQIKNTHNMDGIQFGPIRIRALAGQGNPPAGNFYAWTSSETGAPRSTNPDSVRNWWIRQMPFIGPVAGQNNPIISLQGGPAATIKFVVQPASKDSAGLHDVQERIKGGFGGTWPTIQAVDCAGYNTGAGLTDKDVTLTLLSASQGPVGTNATLWDGTGPTYVGATATPIPTTPWTSWSVDGSMPLTFSVTGVNLTQDFTIRASAPNLTAATSTNVFTVRQRVVSWESIPMIDVPSYNGSTYDVNMYNDPKVLVTDLNGDPVDGATTRMDIRPATPVPSYPALDPIGSASYSQNALTSLIGYADYTNGLIFTLQGFQLNPPPQYRAIAYVYTPYYTTLTPSGNLYLDPRYAIDDRLITNNGLPVELTTFTASLRNQTVSLKWSTATETNNYGFEVERSFDRNAWTKVGFVAGSGTTSSQRDYSFQNALSKADLMNGTISYRLRQIDRDGSIEYSPVVTVSVAPTASSMTLLQNFPNPFNPSTNISFNLPESGMVTLTVYNELGIEVARIHDAAQLEAGWHTAAFNASALPSGLYSYRLSTPAGSVAKTMIVAK